MAKDVAISYLSIVMSFDWFRMITRECCEIYTLWDIYIYITLRWKLQAWSNVKLADYVSKFLLPLFLLKTNKVRNQEKLQKFAHVAHFGFSSQKNIFHHHHHQERKWRKCDKCWLYIIFCDCTWGCGTFFPVYRGFQEFASFAFCRQLSDVEKIHWHFAVFVPLAQFHFDMQLADTAGCIFIVTQCRQLPFDFALYVNTVCVCVIYVCDIYVCDFDPPPTRWH